MDYFSEKPNMQARLSIPKEALNAAKADAIDRFPCESCGFIIDGEYHKQDNSASDPKNDFKIEKFPLGKNVKAIIHSHPNGERHKNGFCYPSDNDMRGQRDSALPWGIIWTDGKVANDPIWFGDSLPVAPLIGRPFIHGIWDCYGIIRDYYKAILNITLEDFPRKFDWWSRNEDLYSQNFAKAGFKRITFNEVQIGDVLLATIQSKVTNHGGIFLGKGLWLDHVCEHYSRRVPVNIWQNKITHYLRYVG